MPDYDPKNIPVLDDIIEDDGDETAASHEKIIVTDEMQADDNTLDLFNESSADIEMDSAQPKIGAIEQVMDHVIDAEIEIDIEASETRTEEIPLDETPADDSDVFESALIDYPHEDDVEQEIESDASAKATDADDEPAINLDLDAIIDDVVTQLLPELEQQLRTRLKQALQESLLLS